MKRKIFILICASFSFVSSFAQTTITGDRVIARQGLYVKDSWIDSVQKSGTPSSDRSLPSSKYIANGAIKNQFNHSSDQGFEIDVFPDIQNVTRTVGTPRFDYGRSMFDWVAANKTTENIKAVLQVGDITNEAYANEFDTAGVWFDKLDAVSIPYLAAIGNHDYVGINPAARNSSTYNAEFGLSRMASKSYWGGYFSNDPLSQEGANSFIKFDVGSRKYLVLNLELFPRDTVLTWAGHVLDSVYAVEPTRETIVITHGYITNSNELARDTSVSSTIEYGMTDANDGQEMWDKLIKLKPSIKWVFNGHFLINATWAKTGLHGRIVSTGVNGNLINQIFVNYQDDLNWGDGYFMRLKFRPSSGKVDVSFFSSYYNANDTRVASYTLDDPSLTVTSSLGINGNVAIAKDLRLQGQFKNDSLHKWGVLFVGDDHSVRDTSNIIYDARSGLKVKGIGLTPQPVLTLVKGDSSKYETPIMKVFNKDLSSNYTIISYWSKPTESGSIYMGDSSGVSTTPTTGGNNGIGNTAFGFRAMARLTTGFLNTAIGGKALLSATTATFNNALGERALMNCTTCQENVASGQAAMMALTTGTFNVGVGNNALGQLTTQTGNTAIGKGAGYGVLGDYNVMIGNRCGYSAGAMSHRLWIDNQDRALPLIYGEFDNRLVKINGKFTITDVLNLPAMTAPSSSADSSGVDGDIKRDSSGNIYLKAGSSWLKFTGTTF